MVKNHFIKDKASEIARGELDLEKGIKKIVSNRMARFFMDSTSAGSAGGNLMDLGLDSDAILTVSLSNMLKKWHNFIIALRWHKETRYHGEGYCSIADQRLHIL